MSLKLKIRYSILALLLMLLLLGGYAFFIIGRLERATPYLPQDYRMERGVLLAFLILSTVVGIVLSIRLPRQVVRPLRRLTADVERVAGPGPATRVAITKNDEVGTVAAAVNRVLLQAQNEQRGTQTELLIERNRLETLVVSLDEGLLLLDQKGTILLANPPPASCSAPRPWPYSARMRVSWPKIIPCCGSCSFPCTRPIELTKCCAAPLSPCPATVASSTTSSQ
jgi:NtrC-family two-component system sensor histidine kinase KinB